MTKHITDEAYEDSIWMAWFNSEAPSVTDENKIYKIKHVLLYCSHMYELDEIEKEIKVFILLYVEVEDCWTIIAMIHRPIRIPSASWPTAFESDSLTNLGRGIFLLE